MYYLQGGLGEDLRLKPVLLTSVIAILCATALDAASFELCPLKVYADPGDFNVRVPLILDSSEDVGAWEILVSYDTTGVEITRVEVVDSVRAVDPQGDTLTWFHSSWSGDPTARPEYLSFVPNADGHPDRVRIIAIMDMVPEPVVPPISMGEDIVLFCFIFDVSPSWQGEEILITFETELCKDNTLTDATGYLTWGPDTASADPATCPQRPDTMRVIRLMSGPGIGTPQSVQDDEMVVPDPKPLLGEVFPNPSGGRTTIPYYLPPGASAQITVWDSQGRQKKTLLHGRRSETSGAVSWDGTDDHGIPLPSGVYFCKILLYSGASDRPTRLEQTRKLVLLR